MSTILESIAVNPVETNSFGKLFAGARAHAKWAALAAVVAGGLAYAWQSNWFQRAGSGSSASLLTFQVQPRDLPITVIERGNLQSQSNLPVYCEVDDYRQDGINGTPIVWVISNGASVEKGDLICELDASAIQTELDEQVLDTEEAKSSLFEAEANLKNQIIQNQTAEEKAELDVRLAELELEMFQDPATGSHQLALEAIERQIDDLNNEILAAEMNLKLRRNENVGIESLFKLGYAGKSELDRSVLSLLQAEGDYAAKLNKLNTQMASLQKLDSFEKQMQKLQLEGKLRTAHQGLQQTKVTNDAQMARMQGILSSRKEQLAKEEERLKRYQDQLAKCKIFAPQDGMIAYASPSSSRDAEIGEGVAVRPRQHIMSIPNLRSMQVETAIHESALDRIKPGLKVAVTIDALPDRTYTGTVKTVAVLPESSYFSDTKTYKTIVTIDDDVYQIKPGMTAVCEVKVDRLPDVNAVPIQAIVQRGGTNWLFLKRGNDVERRRVSLGLSNDQYVAVTEGIAQGDLVVLNPASLVDDSDGDDVSAAPDEGAELETEAEKLVAIVDDSAEID